MSTGFVIVPAMFVAWFVSSLVPAKAFGAYHSVVKAAIAGAAAALTVVLVLLLTKRLSV